MTDDLKAWKERWGELLKDLRCKEPSFTHRLPLIFKTETIERFAGTLARDVGVSKADAEETLNLAQTKTLLVPLSGLMAREIGGSEDKVQQIAGVAAIHAIDEWFSGSSHKYAGDLRSPAIPPESKILAVAEIYEDLVLGRRWPKALSAEEALHEIEKRAWTQLDPIYVKALEAVWKREIQPKVPFRPGVLPDKVPFALSEPDDSLRPYYLFLYAFKKGRRLLEIVGPDKPFGKELLDILSSKANVSDQVLKTEILERFPATVDFLRQRNAVFTLRRWRETPGSRWQKLANWARGPGIPQNTWWMIQNELQRLLPSAFELENPLVLLDHAVLFAFTRLAHFLDYVHSSDKQDAVRRSRADWNHVPKETRATFIEFEFTVFVSAKGKQPVLSLDEALRKLEERSDLWLDPVMVAEFKEWGEAGRFPFYTELKEKERVTQFAENLVRKSTLAEEA